MYKLIKHKVYGMDGTEYSIPKGLEIGGKEIIFPCSIKTNADRNTPYIVEVNNLIIVNFYPWDSLERENANKLGVDLNRNIWAFNQKGELVWKIHPADNPKGVVPETYDSVTLKNGKVVAGNQNERNYYVDTVNGNVEWIEGSYSR